MPADYSLDLRKAVVVHLRADSTVSTLVEGIYGEQPPAVPDGPFIRIGAPVVAPYEATGYDGGEHAFTIHAFAEGPGTDRVATIAKRIVASMAGFELAALDAVENEWRGTQIIQDGDEVDKWHAIIAFDIVAAERAA